MPQDYSLHAALTVFANDSFPLISISNEYEFMISLYSILEESGINTFKTRFRVSTSKQLGNFHI